MFGLGADATGNSVQGNYIGTDLNGTTDVGNLRSGVLISDAASNTIGGTLTGTGNLISGNDHHGIYLLGTGSTLNLVQGNLIGTDLDGALDLGNTLSGVLVNGAVGNTVGGTDVGAGNVISGNDQFGVYLLGTEATANLVQGNLIGTDLNGTADLGNLRSGVLINAAANNTVGGTDVGAGNVISGNDQHGVYLLGAGATGNLIQMNAIGTDIHGEKDLGNTLNGVLVNGAPQNAVGPGNQISGNDYHGVYILGAGATGNSVQGNLIGVDATFTAALGNSRSGVKVGDAPGNTIGGTTPAASNVISGNDHYGVHLSGIGATGNSVQGNYIGTDPFGTTAIGNLRSGVLIDDGVGNTIGGTLTGAGNVISGNQQQGVHVRGANATGNAIQRNSIFSNAGLGINLGIDRITANDTDDTDVGPNQLQNFPVMAAQMTLSEGDLELNYFVDSSTTSSAYDLTVEFFKSDGSGEGQVYLGSDTYTSTDSTNSITMLDVGGLVSEGDQLVATATDLNGNTSEFSVPIFIGLAPAGTLAALDSNLDGQVTPLDALKIINTLNPSDASGESGTRLIDLANDVNRDSRVTALDALLVINELNESSPEQLLFPTVTLDAVWTEDEKVLADAPMDSVVEDQEVPAFVPAVEAVLSDIDVIIDEMVDGELDDEATVDEFWTQFDDLSLT
ncbi:Dockerin type I repeat protein [Planctomycetes bacterium CA13]|uniref:Dockerin type I repeat protein n=1 Tax=Novipirellula herctigrandis TaxID=2527986 RepID=A0A5C5YN38_9BACT|nr:Dockerin type I repeat protein [Planctomycetes bacterium CA13]